MICKVPNGELIALFNSIKLWIMERKENGPYSTVALQYKHYSKRVQSGLAVLMFLGSCVQCCTLLWACCKRTSELSWMLLPDSNFDHTTLHWPNCLATSMRGLGAVCLLSDHRCPANSCRKIDKLFDGSAWMWAHVSPVRSYVYNYG